MTFADIIPGLINNRAFACEPGWYIHFEEFNDPYNMREDETPILGPRLVIHFNEGDHHTYGPFLLDWITRDDWEERSNDI